ncbi:unnamed protein product [Brassica oleracea var. botrytis]|uniref:Uncharacterized protein n=1 Tax=Brassica oleracea TaxID=3712 RepID=A0A3P6F912_BRAOL|nr:unnamed protein product [Brassica oleracea]
MLTSETALLELVGPLRTSETVVLSLTFESVTAQIAPPQTFFSTTHDGSRVVPASIEGNNQSLVSGPSQLQQFPIPEVKSPTNPSDDLAQAPEKFVPSLGSWAKPLFFKSPVTPSKPSTPRDYDPTIVGNQLAALWPTLNDEILNKQPKGKYPSRTIQPPIEKLPPPEIKVDGSLHFPWTARSSAQSRNLYRADTPTYRLDCTPEVSIPFRLGTENKDKYIIGKFHKCSLPPGGLVHAVVNKICRRSCKINCKKFGDSSLMFHIPHQPTRSFSEEYVTLMIAYFLYCHGLQKLPSKSLKSPRFQSGPL